MNKVALVSAAISVSTLLLLLLIMGIDKFGRVNNKKIVGLRGPKGEGFNLTLDGNYDVQNKKIINMGEPKNESDASTKAYVDIKINDLDLRVNNLREYTDALFKAEVKNIIVEQTHAIFESYMKSKEADIQNYVKTILNTENQINLVNKKLAEFQENNNESYLELERLLGGYSNALKTHIEDETARMNNQSKSIKNYVDAELVQKKKKH